MTAYYNEFDPFAVEWLTNLNTRGAIAPGFIDPRSIEELTPFELTYYTQVHLFAGIGVTTAPSGPAPARASRSAVAAKGTDSTTRDTSGPTQNASSKSAALSLFLANRLAQVAQMHGSTLYKLTWKEWATPLGYVRFRLRASALRTKETEHTGARSSWPTPLASNIHTPTTDPQKILRQRERGNQMNLQSIAGLAATWVTPTASNIKNAILERKANGRQQNLQDLVQLTGIGLRVSGSHVGTAHTGRLNPALCRWLMGLPEIWDECSPGWHAWRAVTAMAELKAMATQ